MFSAQAKENYLKALPELGGADPIMMKMRLARYVVNTSGLPPKPLLSFPGTDYTYRSTTPLDKTAWLCPSLRDNLFLEFYDVTQLRLQESHLTAGPSEVIVYKNVAKTSSLVDKQMAPVSEVTAANLVDPDLEVNIFRMGHLLLKFHVVCAACKSLRMKHMHVPHDLVPSTLSEEVIASMLTATAWMNGIESLIFHGYDGSKKTLTTSLEKANSPLDLIDITTENSDNLADIYKNLAQEAQAIRFMNALKSGDVEQAKLVLEDGGFNPAHNDSQLLRDAVTEDNAAFVDLLVRDGRSDPNATQEFSSSAITIALKEGSIDIIKALLRDPKTMLRDVGAFDKALERESADIVRVLLDDPRSDPTENDNEALLNSAAYGDVDIFKMLIEDKRVSLSEELKEEIRGHTDNETVLSLLED